MSIQVFHHYTNVWIRPFKMMLKQKLESEQRWLSIHGLTLADIYGDRFFND